MKTRVGARDAHSCNLHTVTDILYAQYCYAPDMLYSSVPGGEIDDDDDDTNTA